MGGMERDKDTETVVQGKLQGERYGLAAADVLDWLAQVVNNDQLITTDAGGGPNS
jgi:hypothetical protein